MKRIVSTGLVLLVGACSSVSAAPPPIVASGGADLDCGAALNPADWVHRQTEPTEMGGIYINVSGRAPVTIDSAELVNAKGLKLVETAFVRGGGVSQGLFWSQAVGQRPDSWSHRVAMPGAVLTLGTTAWEGVAGVIPTSPAGGSAEGLNITYRFDGQQFSAQSQDHMGLEPTQAGCDAVAAAFSA